jgi:hypothetical protein
MDALKPVEPKSTCTVTKEMLDLFMYLHDLFIPLSFAHNQKVQKHCGHCLLAERDILFIGSKLREWILE